MKKRVAIIAVKKEELLKLLKLEDGIIHDIMTDRWNIIDIVIEHPQLPLVDDGCALQRINLKEIDF